MLACPPFTGRLITEAAGAPTGATLNMLSLGVFPTALAFTTWAYALARTTAGRLGATTYAVPALVVPMSWLLLDEVARVADPGRWCAVPAGGGGVAPPVAPHRSSARRSDDEADNHRTR